MQNKESMLMDLNRKKEIQGFVAEKIFFICALISVICVFTITIFVFAKGVKPFLHFNKEGYYSFVKFITGNEWRPNDDINKAIYGVFYMIVGSILATTGAIIIGVPISVLTATYIAELASEKVVWILKPMVELLAGIPSVLYGIFGLGIIVPFIMKVSPEERGQSLFAAILVLSIMILPTVIALSESALKAVPNSYREGSLALGATKIQTIFNVTIPAAKSGILTGVVLGIGRAIGETMAIMLVAGNSIAGIPDSIWCSIRPLTTNIAMEMGYAFGLHQEMLFSTGVVLFVFIIIINLILNRITAKVGEMNA